MLVFMDYLSHVFYKTIGWDVDNFYSDDDFAATSKGILHFAIPSGLQIGLSSLPTPNFGNCYTFSALGDVHGKLEYLYSSRPLENVVSRSADLDLSRLVRGYRELSQLKKPVDPDWWAVWHRGQRVDKKDSLFYATLHLPDSILNALYLRHLSPTKLLDVRLENKEGAIKNKAELIVTLRTNCAKYSTDSFFLPYSQMVGVRALYNFGPDPRKFNSGQTAGGGGSSLQNQLSRLSMGGEFMVSSGLAAGVSLGLRFSTLPPYSAAVPLAPSVATASSTAASTAPTSSSSASSSPAPPIEPRLPLDTQSTFPYTMTLLVNPPMGWITSSYSVRAGQNLAMSSEMKFNLYSYESSVVLGAEFWQRDGGKGSNADRNDGSLEQAANTDDNIKISSSESKDEEEGEGFDRILSTNPSAASISSLFQRPQDDRNSVSNTRAAETDSTDPETDPNPVTSILRTRINQNLQMQFLYETRYRHLVISVGAKMDLRAPFPRNRPSMSSGQASTTASFGSGVAAAAGQGAQAQVRFPHTRPSRDPNAVGPFFSSLGVHVAYSA